MVRTLERQRKVRAEGRRKRDRLKERWKVSRNTGGFKKTTGVIKQSGKEEARSCGCRNHICRDICMLICVHRLLSKIM
jgi:hypothetical protein